MATGGQAELENYQTCGVCWLEYNNKENQPKFLQCHHTICLACVDKLINNSKIMCPICRQETAMQYHEATGKSLQTNFHIDELRYVIKATATNAGLCEDHGLPLDIWCFTCVACTCSKCAYTSHKAHDHDHVDNIRQKSQSHIESTVALLEAKRKLMHENLETLRQNKLCLNQSLESCDRELEKIYLDVKRKLKSLKNDINMFYGKKLDTDIDKMTVSLTSVDSLLSLHEVVKNSEDSVKKVETANNVDTLNKLQVLLSEEVVKETGQPWLVHVPLYTNSIKIRFQKLFCDLPLFSKISRGAVNISSFPLPIRPAPPVPLPQTRVSVSPPSSSTSHDFSAPTPKAQPKGIERLDIQQNLSDIETDLHVQIGSRGSAQGQFGNSIHIALGVDSKLYVSDTENKRIQQFTNCSCVNIWCTGKWYPGPLVVDTKAGEVICAAFKRRLILRSIRFVIKAYTIWGETRWQIKLKEFGISNIQALALNSKEQIICSHNGYHTLSIFDIKLGRLVAQLGGQVVHLRTNTEQLNMPIGVCLLSTDNDMLIADSGNQCIKLLDENGRLKKIIGSKGHGDGQFLAPAGIALTPNYILASDSKRRDIQFFTYDGNFVYCIRERMVRPQGLVVTESHVYVADCDSHCIHRFSLRDCSELG